MDSLSFARAVRLLAPAARGYGLEVPGFRAPPRVDGANRTLRQRPDGSTWVVAVRLAGRPDDEVIVDMVDGLLAANPGVAGRRRHTIRRQLLDALAPPD